MKERYFSLSGNDWSILPDSEGLPYETVCYVQNGWIAARVPGNIQWDLESANLLRPLWYGDGDPELVNVPRRDWWYRKTFKLSNGLAFERQTLVFEGVDYSCDVYLNGTYLGRNEGMFKQFAFDVTDILSRKHVNTLLVRIDRMPEELLEWIVDSDGPMSAEGTDHFFVFANNKIRQTLKGLKSPANIPLAFGKMFTCTAQIPLVWTGFK